MFMSAETVRRRLVIAMAAGVAGLLACAPGTPASAQQPIQLKLAHFLPTANGMHKDFMQPWAHDLETCSKGKVKVTIYPGGTQLGNIGRLYDEVRTGVVDIAHGLSGIPAGQFERTRLMELPFMVKSAGAAAQALWDLEPELAPDFSGVKLLALHSPNAGQIHTVNKRVRTMADLKGLRIRFPSEAIKLMLEHLGAVPVGLPPGAVYENMEKGVIDGAAFTWDTMDFVQAGRGHQISSRRPVLRDHLLVRDEQEALRQPTQGRAGLRRQAFRQGAGRQIRPLVERMG